jgi:hypothetical protein
MGTKVLSIPWCSVQGNWSEYMDLKNFLRSNVTDLEYLDLSGCNGSGTCDGDDSMTALLVSKSKKLAVLDLSTSRLTLIKTIMNKLTWPCSITSLNLSVVGNIAHQDLLQYEMVKMIIDKCRQLKDLIMVGTDFCKKAITYICKNLTETILRLNLSRERVCNGDIVALAKQCTQLQYLNISETLVSYDAFFTIILTWQLTMVYMYLPQQIGVTLELDTNAIASFDGLEDLTVLWKNNQINAIESPSLTLLAQFKVMIDSMPHLRFLHIGDWNGQMLPNYPSGTQLHTAVLMRMFPQLTIQLSPFDLRSPVEEDPYFLFSHIGKSRTST